VDVDFSTARCKERARELLERANSLRAATAGTTAKINPKEYKNRTWVTRPRPAWIAARQPG